MIKNFHCRLCPLSSRSFTCIPPVEGYPSGQPYSPHIACHKRCVPCLRLIIPGLRQPISYDGGITRTWYDVGGHPAYYVFHRLLCRNLSSSPGFAIDQHSASQSMADIIAEWNNLDSFPSVTVAVAGKYGFQLTETSPCCSPTPMHSTVKLSRSLVHITGEI